MLGMAATRAAIPETMNENFEMAAEKVEKAERRWSPPSPPLPAFHARFQKKVKKKIRLQHACPAFWRTVKAAFWIRGLTLTAKTRHGNIILELLPMAQSGLSRLSCGVGYGEITSRTNRELFAARCLPKALSLAQHG